MSIEFRISSNDGTLPVKGTSGSAGWDVFSSENVMIPPGKSRAVGTCLHTSFPPDTVCFVKPRSGLALKNSIDVLAGVVDSDYKGEIKVILINHGDGNFHIKKGDRVAQLVFLSLSPHNPTGKTIRAIRGSEGFGSTNST